MRATLLYWLCATTMLALPVIGYIWPQPTASSKVIVERDWQWPKAAMPTTVEPQPALLARFWPVQLHDKSSDDKDSVSMPTAQALTLVAIIGQNNDYQALVLTASGKLQTLTTGDALDETRQISAITANTIRWHATKMPLNNEDNAAQNASQSQRTHGELALFPRPGLSQSLSTHSADDAITRPADTSLVDSTHE